jgi:hypothetical protein
MRSKATLPIAFYGPSLPSGLQTQGKSTISADIGSRNPGLPRRTARHFLPRADQYG